MVYEADSYFLGTFWKWDYLLIPVWVGGLLSDSEGINLLGS
jgi:hypothetical protein